MLLQYIYIYIYIIASSRITSCFHEAPSQYQSFVSATSRALLMSAPRKLEQIYSAQYSLIVQFHVVSTLWNDSEGRTIRSRFGARGRTTGLPGARSSTSKATPFSKDFKPSSAVKNQSWFWFPHHGAKKGFPPGAEESALRLERQ